MKPIAVRFDGGKLTSDAGAVLLRQVDQKLRLTERINALIHDPRDPFDSVPQQRDLIAQRISDEEPAGLSKLFVELFVELFLESFDVPPKQIGSDVDATDDTIHGIHAVLSGRTGTPGSKAADARKKHSFPCPSMHWYSGRQCGVA